MFDFLSNLKIFVVALCHIIVVAFFVMDITDFLYNFSTSTKSSPRNFILISRIFCATWVPRRSSLCFHAHFKFCYRIQPPQVTFLRGFSFWSEDFFVLIECLVVVTFVVIHISNLVLAIAFLASLTNFL